MQFGLLCSVFIWIQKQISANCKQRIGIRVRDFTNEGEGAFVEEEQIHLL
jgi:hypothetical protein